MKKFVTAILMFELIAGLLFLGLQESRGQIPAAGEAAAEIGGSGAADGRNRRDKRDVTDDEDVTDEGNVRKVAITFDDEVIIGLSQEISYKKAISMI